jgi:hypothetical protein
VYANGKRFSDYTKTSSACDASSPHTSFVACWAVGRLALTIGAPVRDEFEEAVRDC